MEDYSRECAFNAKDDLEWMEEVVMSSKFNPTVTKPEGDWSTLMCCLHLLYESRVKSKLVRFRKGLYTHRTMFRCLNLNNINLKSPALTLARQCLLELYVKATMNNDEGKRFLSLVASEMDKEFLQLVVDKFVHVCQTTAHKPPAQRTSAKIMLEDYMGDMLFRIFNCVSDSVELGPHYNQIIAKLEHTCLRAGSGASGGMFSVYRQLLKPINVSKLKSVKEFLLNSFFLELTSCSHSPNYRVRENSIRMLADVFPLVSLDNLPVAEHERQLEENLELILRGLEDPNIAVRCASIATACDVIYNFSRIIPASFLEQVAKVFVNKLARDTSSARVRCSLLDGISQLIQQHYVQEFVYQMILPHIGHMLHDVNPKTRLGMAKLVASTAYLDRSNSQFVSPDDIIARLQKDSIQAILTDSKGGGACGGAEILSRLILGSLMAVESSSDDTDLSGKLDKIVELAGKYPTLIPHILAQDDSGDVDKLKLAAALFLYAFRQLDVHEQRVSELNVKEWCGAKQDLKNSALAHSIVLLASSLALLKPIKINKWSDELLTFVSNRFNPELLNFALSTSVLLRPKSPLLALAELVGKIYICILRKINNKIALTRMTDEVKIFAVLEKNRHVGKPMWHLYIELACVINPQEGKLVSYFDEWIKIFQSVRKVLWENKLEVALGESELRTLSGVLQSLPILCAEESEVPLEIKTELYNKILFDFMNTLEQAVKGICARDDHEYTSKLMIPHFVDLLRTAISIILRRKKNDLVSLPDIYQIILQAMGRVQRGSQPTSEGRGICELCHALIEGLTIICERSKVHAGSLMPLRNAIGIWASNIVFPGEKSLFMQCVQKCLLTHMRIGANTNVAEIEDTIVLFLQSYSSSIDLAEHRFEFVSPGICQNLRRYITDEAKRSRVSDQGDDDENENVMSALNASYIDPPHWQEIVRFLKLTIGFYGETWLAKMHTLFEENGSDLMRHLFYALINLQNVTSHDIALNQAKAVDDILEDQTEVLKILESVTGQTPQRPIQYSSRTDLS